jgi:diacylglycerol kinase family enzyme
MTKIVFLINRHSGRGRTNKTFIQRTLYRIIRDKGLSEQDYEFQFISFRGKDLRVVLDQIEDSGYNVYVAAGGDGTINTVASRLIGTDKCLAVLPVGTVNRLAKDLKIPIEVKKALEVILTGSFKRVDTATVNGKPFLNTSTIGIYARAIYRKHYLQSRGVGKFSARYRGFYDMFKRFRNKRLYIKFENFDLKIKTPFMFVGNGNYTRLFRKVSRKDISSGAMNIFMPRGHTRTELVKTLLMCMLRRPDDVFELLKYQSRKFTVYSKKKVILVSTDGEIESMKSPLTYEVKPASLNVLAP